MTLQGQRVQPERYTITPRTLSFLVRGDQVLLMRIAPSKGPWAGLYDGVGGHVEKGEDPLTAARREIREETGVVPQDLRLCGTIIVDVGSKPGIGLYVFVGSAPSSEVRSSDEGRVEWLAIEALDPRRLVADIPLVLPRALAAYRGAPPFTALTNYGPNGEMTITFSA